MKKLLIMSAMALFALSVSADNLCKVVFEPTPAMSCQNCENKIKSNIRYVKGTKSIETSLDDNTVTIVYNADKAKISDYEKAFREIGREVTVVEPKNENPSEQTGCKHSCCQHSGCENSGCGHQGCGHAE